MWKDGRARFGARAVMGFALASSVLSCMLVVSFDPYDVTPLEGPERKVTAMVDGLDDGVTASLRLNGDPRVITAGNRVAVEFPARLFDGTDYAVHAEATLHECPDETGPVNGADVTGVVVHCRSRDARLTELKATLAAAVAELTPALAPDRREYVASFRLLETRFGTADTQIIATTRSAAARMSIGGNVSPSPLRVPAPFLGQPLPVEVTVTPATGTDEAVYKLTIEVGETPLTVPSTPPYTRLGTSVAMSGNTLVVGASGSTDLPGRVYVFTRAGRVWTQQAILSASNSRADSNFGVSVALDGDTLAVGSDRETSNAMGVGGDESNTSAASAGAVYVFTRTGETWSQQAYVKASNTRPNSVFGCSVALSAGTLAVGAYGETSGSPGVNGSQTDSARALAGAVYVFTRTGAVWSQQAYVKASNARESSMFGASVALSGDTLVVGAPFESSKATGIGGNQNDTSLPGTGAVYVFTRTSGIWSQQEYVKASNARQAAEFGVSVALAGDRLAVGAPGDSSAGPGVDGNQATGGLDLLGSGAAYLFLRTNGVWAQRTFVKASNPAQSAFGERVAFSGDFLAVSAPSESSAAKHINGDELDLSENAAGAVYLFGQVGGTWSQMAYVKAPNARTQERFGTGIAVTNDTLAVGAPLEGLKATIGGSVLAGAGAVHVY